MLDSALTSSMGRQYLCAVSEQSSCTSGASEVPDPATVHSTMLQHTSCLITTADFESCYAREVLCLQDGDTEERLDRELRTEAGDLGDETCAQIAEEPRSHRATAMSSELSRRSQESVASRMSQSTGMMSNMSDVSRDHFTHSAGRHHSRASISFRDYDAFLSRGTPSARQSFSFSPPTTPSQSTFSLPLSSPDSSPKRHFPRIRGLSMLRLHRTMSTTSLNNSCPHCPPGQLSQQKAVHKLPCGHRLCTQALRDIIKVGMNSETGALPSHCGAPIPGSLVEHVMTRAERSAFLDNMSRWDDAASLVPANAASEGMRASATQRPGALSSSTRTVSNESKVDSVNTQAQKEVDLLVESSEYKQMKIEQAEIGERFKVWIEAQRSALEIQHQRLKEELKLRHEACLEELLERHNAAMDEAEDKQVKTEADMRHCHSQEKRDNATALKHMEAYCAGTYSTGEPHMRIVTEPDLAELQKTRRTRDQMDARHESAINVLRGEQSRRMRMRAQRQGREVQELGRAQKREQVELDHACSQAMHQLDEMMLEKRRRLRLRSQLQTAILLKKVEKQPGTTVRSQFSSVDWQPVKVEVGPMTSAIASVPELEKAHELQMSLTNSRAVV